MTQQYISIFRLFTLALSVIFWYIIIIILCKRGNLTMNTKELRVFAEEIRVETLYELAHLGFGHIGGAMSIVELLAVLERRLPRCQLLGIGEQLQASVHNLGY